MTNFSDKVKDYCRLLGLSIKLQHGERYWLIPLLVLIWPLIQWLRLFMGYKTQDFVAADVQNILIGFPLYIVAIGTGVLVIANEVERRTLEVNYTVPGGTGRVWMSKLVALSLLLLVCELVLALCCWLMFTHFGFDVLYRVFQGALFYLIFAMAAGAFLKSELMASVVVFMVFFANTTMTTSRWSVLFNPFNSQDVNQQELLEWTMQNHIGVALLIVGIAALTFNQVEGREKMLAK